MKNFDDYKKQLGLERSALGEEEEFELSGDGVARGYAALEMEVGEFVRDKEPLFLEATAAEEMDFKVAYFEERPQLVRVWAPGENFSPRSANDDVAVYSEEEGEYYLDFGEESSPVALVNEQGEGLFFAESGQRLRIAQLLRVPESLSLKVELSSPIDEWLESSDDDWVCELTEQKLALGDGWEYLVALGIFHRLEETTDREAREHMIKQILAGEQPDKAVRVLRWADRLEDGQVDRLSALTLGALEQLRDEIEELRQSYEDGAEIEAREVRDMLHLRDDIESALVLLSRTEAIDKMSKSVAGVDLVGRELVRDLRLELEIIEDERLRRVSAFDPGAWWAEIARHQIEIPEDD